jgi:uncharacterized protein YxjI
MTVDPNQHDSFFLSQRIRPVINQYEFSLAEGEPPFCFVEQKRFKFKEDIGFFTDASKTVELMRLKARQRFDPAARYDVTAPGGERIGQIQKQFGSSLLRSTYTLYDAEGNETATAREKSLAVALFRRLAGFIPYVGDFADWLPIPYHFVIARGDEPLGVQSRRHWRLRDTYDLDLTADAARTLDRRLVLALAVGLDALQAR